MSARRQRLAAHYRGHTAELAAAALLMAHGYLVLARRFKSPAGEVDLIGRRGKRLAFVEVKFRPTRALCEEAITAEARTRVRRAADLWLARHPGYQTHDIGFDAIFVVPWRLPAYVRDGL